MKVTVLLSLGRHPKSGRPMLAPNDARALAIAKKLTDRPRLVHVGGRPAVGSASIPGPRLRAIGLIESPDGQDICGALIADLKGNPCDLLLAGQNATGQDDTGLVPYIVAQGLGLDLVDRALSIADGNVTQFLPRATSSTTLPSQCVVTVSDKAPLELEYVARRARQGRIEILKPESAPTAALYQGWQLGSQTAGPQTLDHSIQCQWLGSVCQAYEYHRWRWRSAERRCRRQRRQNLVRATEKKLLSDAS